jgi:chemotaxis protein methyltransferase CheR
MTLYTDTHLDDLSTLIAERTGLDTFTRNRQLLMTALQRDNVQDLPQFLATIGQFDDSHPLWQSLLSELTVGETYFMRDTAQMNMLKHELLPQLIKKRYQQQNLRLNIWSTGCATGEEAYSLAILIWQLLPQRQHWHITITGTDINGDALHIARQAIYRSWSFRHTSADFRTTYFIPRGVDAYEVRPEIRNMVRFQHDNLVHTRLIDQDLILCRNVLIYFTRAQSNAAEQSLHAALRSGGWLMLSPVETLHKMRHHFHVHRLGDTILFQKQSRNTEASTNASVTTPDAPMDYYQLAVEAFHADRINSAQHLLDQVKESTNTATTILRAAIEIACGDVQIARQRLETITQQYPFLADAHYLLALLQLEQGNDSAARTSVRAALYCQPQHLLALMLSGELHMRGSDYAHATGDWSRVRELAAALPPETFLSDVAKVTAGQLVVLMDSRLE